MSSADDEPLAPDGVELWDPQDVPGMRKMIERDVTSAMQKYVHGFEYGDVRLELADINSPDKEEFDLDEQRESLLNDKTIARRLRGTVRLVDTNTGEVLDQKKNLTLLRLPWLSERGTASHNGTNYSLISQSRLLSGPYTRKRDDGTVECHINVRPGTGRTMRVHLDPETAQYRVKVGGASGSADVHAYSLFNALGVSDQDLERRWGKDVLEMNKAKLDKKALDRFYEKSVSKWKRPSENPTQEEKVQAVKDALEAAQVTKSITLENLPTLINMVKAAEWRAVGAAMDKAERMIKSASESFSPDLSPNQLAQSVAELDFDARMIKRAFSPDLAPDELAEAHRYLHCGVGPRLASMAAWPDHWINDSDPTGWLEWYDKYCQGRRHDDDRRQIARWKRFKRLHGKQFVINPSPRRAYALRNWAIDPLRLLDPEKRESFKAEMEAYRRVEYAKWLMSRPGFGPDVVERMLEKARRRGFVCGQCACEDNLLEAARTGHITTDDLC